MIKLSVLSEREILIIICLAEEHSAAMPMENMVHMFGGTKKKSTLVDERVIFFAREDEDSPRQDILSKFCSD